VAVGGCEVKRGVGFVGVVGVLEEAGVEAEDAGEEREVVEVDCAADADGWVDPGWVRGWGGGGDRGKDVHGYDGRGFGRKDCLEARFTCLV
jgi:hypothetical protein